MEGIIKEDEEGKEEGVTSIFQNSPHKINVIVTKWTFSPRPESSSPVPGSTEVGTFIIMGEWSINGRHIALYVGFLGSRSTGGFKSTESIIPVMHSSENCRVLL